MPRFEPFAALRYRESIDLDVVTAPPYDVIDDHQRAVLATRSPYNAVRVELPVDDDGCDRYQVAARLLATWMDEGVLVADESPSFFLYRMGFTDEHGRVRQTSGVIGALELSVPGEGDVLPHEQTTPRAKSDRLALLQATGCNLSPIWCLSPAKGLAQLVEPSGPPLARCTDESGTHHRLWAVRAPALIGAISALVASAPLVIADGHHRYETALALRQLRERAGAGPGAHDLIMALVVELTESELAVRAIHRLLGGLPREVDVVTSWAPLFEARPVTTGPADLLELLAPAGSLGLVLADGSSWLLRPRPGAFPDDLPDLDAARVEHARQLLPPHEVTYHHDHAAAVAGVGSTEGAVAVMLRPATVAQIAATAERGECMPAKTTYFHPKPRTGMVFRSIDPPMGSL